MEPLAAAYTAFMTVLTERSESPIRRSLEILVSLFILTLFFGMFLETLSRNEISFDPGAGVYQIVVVLGLSDAQWIDSAIQWLERPTLSPLAVLGAVLSGVVVFWNARYSGETAWLLLLAFSVTLGSQAFWLAGFAWASTTLVLGITGWMKTRFEFSGRGVKWFGFAFAFEQSIRGLVTWALIPFMLVFRLINGVIETVTYEPRQVGVASGAVPLSND